MTSSLRARLDTISDRAQYVHATSGGKALALADETRIVVAALRAVLNLCDEAGADSGAWPSTVGVTQLRSAIARELETP